MSTLALRALRSLPALHWPILACALLAIADLSRWVDLPGPTGSANPLATLLILLHAAGLPSADATRRRLVLAGLALSFLGDCLLVVPAQLAPALGTGLFVLAQGCYLAMVLRITGRPRPSALLLVHAVVVACALALWSARPLSEFLPNAVFLCLLGLMAAQAELWWWRVRHTAEATLARRAALGGLLWFCADLWWTFSQHVAWVPGTTAAVLVLYWLAQWNLASTLSAGNAAGTNET